MAGLLTTAEYKAIAKSLSLPTQAFIDGAFRPAKSGKTFDTLNPATGTVLAKVAACGADDVDLAVVKARAAFDDGRTRLGSNSFLTLNLHSLQILFDLVLFQDLRRVTELFDHEHRGVLVDRLVDGGHDAHVHQYLDDFGRLDSHLSREVRDGDGLTDTHFAHDGSRGHFETVFAAVGRRLHRPSLHTALFLVARAYVASNMQLLTPISGIGVWAAGRSSRARWRRGSRSA